MINVDPEKQSDAFYRYKMPRLSIKVEGNGNGIKTVVCNIVEISERLGRNVEYPMRFFAQELATTSKLKDEKWILMGSHAQDKVQSSVFDFIKRFVLCKACRNPETVIRVDEKKNIFLDCKACSRTTDIAPTEKLCNVILKYEKTTTEKVDKVIAEANDKEKKEKKSKKEKKDKSKDEKEEEKLNLATRQAAEGDTILSEEIVRENPVHVLKEYINMEPTPSIDDIVSKVRDIKEEYGLTEDKHVVALVFEALFDKDIAKQFPLRHKILARFIKAEVEKEVITNLMILCAEEETLKPKFHILLKKFYDAELIAEDAIMEWFNKKKGPKGISKDTYALFKEKATPFVDWLQQADDEDEEEESEEEAPKDAKPSPKISSPTKKPDDGGDNEDDIDIDAI